MFFKIVTSIHSLPEVSRNISANSAANILLPTVLNLFCLLFFA